MNYEPTLSLANEEYAQVNDPDFVKQRGRRRTIIISVVIALMVVGGLVYSRYTKPKPVVSASQVPNVSVTSAKHTAVQRIVSTTGTLAAKREMPVGAVGDGGMVSRVFVEPGDWVKAGQVLATVERSVQSAQNAASVAQINVAQANANIAQSNLDRARALIARGFISKADVDSKTATRDAAIAQVSVARAQLRESEARTRRLDIRAPAAGLVLSRAVEAGQVVGPASGVLFRIAADGQIELKAQLSEADLGQLKLGDTADVTPIGTQTSFSGHIWQVAPIIDPQTRQGIARIALSYNPALRPGGFAAAKLKLGTLNAPLLPQSSVLASDRGNYVYVIDAQNKAQKRSVTIADVSDAGVAIGTGLDGSERVVVSAGAFLTPNEVVNPIFVSQPQ